VLFILVPPREKDAWLKSVKGGDRKNSLKKKKDFTRKRGKAG